MSGGATFTTTIPAGTTIQVRNNETIDSQTAQVGQTFSGVVEQEVQDANGRTARRGTMQLSGGTR